MAASCLWSHGNLFLAMASLTDFALQLATAFAVKRYASGVSIFSQMSTTDPSSSNRFTNMVLVKVGLVDLEIPPRQASFFDLFHQIAYRPQLGQLLPIAEATVRS